MELTDQIRRIGRLAGFSIILVLASFISFLYDLGSVVTWKIWASGISFVGFLIFAIEMYRQLQKLKKKQVAKAEDG